MDFRTTVLKTLLGEEVINESPTTDIHDFIRHIKKHPSTRVHLSVDKSSGETTTKGKGIPLKHVAHAFATDERGIVDHIKKHIEPQNDFEGTVHIKNGRVHVYDPGMNL
jgi:hypothetical protein